MSKPVNPDTWRICSYCNFSYQDRNSHDYEFCLSRLEERRNGLIDSLTHVSHSIKTVRRILSEMHGE